MRSDGELELTVVYSESGKEHRDPMAEVHRGLLRGGCERRAEVGERQCAGTEGKTEEHQRWCYQHQGAVMEAGG